MRKFGHTKEGAIIETAELKKVGGVLAAFEGLHLDGVEEFREDVGAWGGGGILDDFDGSGFRVGRFDEGEIWLYSC